MKVHFTHLSRRQFVSVLTKRLRDLPLKPLNGSKNASATRQRIVSDLTGWLFSRNGLDRGQVELSLANASEGLIKYRRDFLTGAVVDKAVQQACTDACHGEHEGRSAGGVTVERLMACFDQQIRAICDQLNQFNAASYVELPDAARVTAVRRLAQPAVLPFQLQRAS